MANYIEIDDLKIVQTISLEMLIFLDKLCSDADIPYSLAGGTLLGALRHGGFIPWDDDIDIFMLRPDYERFIETYKDKEFDNPNYRLDCLENGNLKQPFARIVDLRTKCSSVKSSTMSHIWLDILALDAIPESEEDREKHVSRLSKMRTKRLLINMPMYSGAIVRSYFSGIKNALKDVKKALKKLVKALLYIFKPMVAFILRKFDGQRKISEEITKEVCSIPFDSVTEVGELVAQAKVKGIMNKDTFRDSVEVEFEGKKFKAMPDYDYYLKGQYGDYMQIPPVNEQKTTHSIQFSIDLDAYHGATKEKIVNIINSSKEEKVEE